MYYKIENKDCEVYKKLYELRTNELQIEKENIKLIEQKTGLTWKNYFGHGGQQNFRRVTSYTGFAFNEVEKINFKIWKKHKDFDNVFIPNNKFNKGKQMSNFLNNGLKGSNFMTVLDILKIEFPHSRFTFPYVEINNDIILMFLDEIIEINNKDIIEITKKEFYELIDTK